MEGKQLTQRRARSGLGQLPASTGQGRQASGQLVLSALASSFW